jgi:2-polyprenyl-3-methyl-5-hydroxy-6-metoxy-1,4-benzoquinol methylase
MKMLKDVMQMHKMRCYVCGSTNNSPRLAEAPIERRFGKPVLPCDEYSQNQCHECGLLFVTCSVTEEYLNNLYASESVDWQKEFLQTESSVGEARMVEFRRLSKMMVAAGARDNSGTNKKRLLDFGCQTGEFVKIVSEIAEIEPFGVEMSADYAKHAVDLWGEGSVHVGQLEDAPFPKASFDFVSAQETLEHLVDPQQTLEGLRALMKNDGIILISVPSSDYFILKKRIFTLLGRHGMALVHTHLYNFTPQSLRIMLKKASFEPLQIFGIGWHDSAESIGNAASAVINKLTNGSKVYSPSVVAIARAV